jgi:hypothetical protein
MVVQIQGVTASFWVRHGSLTEVAVLMHVPPLSNEDVILRPQRARVPTRAETSIAWQWYRGPGDVPSLGEIRLPGKGGVAGQELRHHQEADARAHQCRRRKSADGGEVHCLLQPT